MLKKLGDPLELYLSSLNMPTTEAPSDIRHNSTKFSWRWDESRLLLSMWCRQQFLHTMLWRWDRQREQKELESSTTHSFMRLRRAVRSIHGGVCKWQSSRNGLLGMRPQFHWLFFPTVQVDYYKFLRFTTSPCGFWTGMRLDGRWIDQHWLCLPNGKYPRKHLARTS